MRHFFLGIYDSLVTKTSFKSDTSHLRPRTQTVTQPSSINLAQLLLNASDEMRIHHTIPQFMKVQRQQIE